jgi:hypothetical protein
MKSHHHKQVPATAPHALACSQQPSSTSSTAAVMLTDLPIEPHRTGHTLSHHYPLVSPAHSSSLTSFRESSRCAASCTAHMQVCCAASCSAHMQVCCLMPTVSCTCIHCRVLTSLALLQVLSGDDNVTLLEQVALPIVNAVLQPLRQ